MHIKGRPSINPELTLYYQMAQVCPTRSKGLGQVEAHKREIKYQPRPDPLIKWLQYVQPKPDRFLFFSYIFKDSKRQFDDARRDKNRKGRNQNKQSMHRHTGVHTNSV